MILSAQRVVREAIAAAIDRQFALADPPAIAVEVPPRRELGDLALPVAFQLARPLKKAPRAIAQQIADNLDPIAGVTRCDVAPNGYLNIFLDRPSYLLARVHGHVDAFTASPDKTIVEHTAINPNKAAHIGHLRNAALGDTLGRVLRFMNVPVEIQNYIDDTGVQVADVIVGFRELERRSLEEIEAIANSTRFDYYCWDLYSRVTEWYEADKTRLSFRAQALHDLEHGGNEIAEIGLLLVDRIVRAHLHTMARLNIAYDLLTYEGDILRLHFWSRAFEILKERGAVFLQTEGKLAGCWVMRIDDGQTDPAAGEPDGAVDLEENVGLEQYVGSGFSRTSEHSDLQAREKVIVRSNGVVTYVGKDIANQFWKFGLLGRDFRYRKFAQQGNGQTLWATTSGESDAEAPPFGRARRILNVIDSRQMYLQALLSQALRELGYEREAQNSVHFSYEMVGLSHATARELGYPSDPETDKKPFVEVSGRRGLGVKIDDLLDLLGEKALKEVQTRNPDMSDGEARRIAAQIAVAAIRYFMLKFSRGKLIVFDMEEALSFEGETGPYLQYAVVRAGNIFHKLKEREGIAERDILADLAGTAPDEILEADSALWALVLESSRLDEIVDQVCRSLEFSGLAKYAFGLAQLFNAFYHQSPVLNEERVDRKRWRAAGIAYFKAQMTRALDLMGIETPARM
jgi:arginyl-tRNA synthetase